MAEPDPGPVQIPLPFPVRSRLGRETFCVSVSNQAALDLVDRWPRWPSHACAIFAPVGAGKTHLLHVWAAQANAHLVEGARLDRETALSLPEPLVAAIDDADIVAQDVRGADALFHLLNRAQQEGGYVLMSGQTHPSHWRTPLPDLATRLSALTAVHIEPPDDALMAAVLTKLFSDLQLSAPPGLISYVVARIERRFDAAEDFARAMDRETIGTGRTLSYDLAQRLIAPGAHD